VVTPKVVKVFVPEPYLLDVTFEDGEHRVIDMKGHMKGKIFEPLHHPDFFAKVSIDPIWHTLVWPNGADVSPEFLYEQLAEKAGKA